jgi:GrpB-like predicted nucleotidyltransferase (UPF0157 family)
MDTPEPTDVRAYEERLEQVTVGGAERLMGRIELRDHSDEQAYVPDLEAAGLVLRIREPDWFEHRLLKDSDPAVNVHVFSAGCEETDRMVRFRDRLRANDADRDRYARVKRELASRDWNYVQQYADATGTVIRSILEPPDASS